MQTVTSFQMRVIPATDLTGGKAFSHWKADVDGKQWGKVNEIDGAPTALTFDEFRQLAEQALGELAAVCLMTPEEMAATEAAAKAAAEEAMRKAS